MPTFYKKWTPRGAKWLFSSLRCRAMSKNLARRPLTPARFFDISCSFVLLWHFLWDLQGIFNFICMRPALGFRLFFLHISFAYLCFVISFKNYVIFGIPSFRILGQTFILKSASHPTTDWAVIRWRSTYCKSWKSGLIPDMIFFALWKWVEGLNKPKLKIWVIPAQQN